MPRDSVGKAAGRKALARGRTPGGKVFGRAKDEGETPGYVAVRRGCSGSWGQWGPASRSAPGRSPMCRNARPAPSLTRCDVDGGGESGSGRGDRIRKGAAGGRPRRLAAAPARPVRGGPRRGDPARRRTPRTPLRRAAGRLRGRGGRRAAPAPRRPRLRPPGALRRGLHPAGGVPGGGRARGRVRGTGLGGRQPQHRLRQPLPGRLPRGPGRPPGPGRLARRLRRRPLGRPQWRPGRPARRERPHPARHAVRPGGAGTEPRPRAGLRTRPGRPRPRLPARRRGRRPALRPPPRPRRRPLEPGRPAHRGRAVPPVARDRLGTRPPAGRRREPRGAAAGRGRDRVERRALGGAVGRPRSPGVPGGARRLLPGGRGRERGIGGGGAGSGRSVSRARGCGRAAAAGGPSGGAARRGRRRRCRPW